MVSEPKPKLLVVELWGLGDLVIATPFLQAACQKYAVTLLAKPYALDLRPRLWPEVQVVPFVAPWTAFLHKYRLFRWPWREFLHLRRLDLRPFEVGLSARWDPRDHLLLCILRAKRRLGFSRMGSRMFLTHPLTRPDLVSHRFENWRVLAEALGLEIPAPAELGVAAIPQRETILVHTGAGQSIRVWPLDHYRKLVERLRREHYRLQVACDPDQEKWWSAAGETGVVSPRTVTELIGLIDRAGIFIGNDSGPGHLAAHSGCLPSRFSDRNCPRASRRCIRRPNGLKGNPARTNPATIIVNSRRPIACGTWDWRTFGLGLISLSNVIAPRSRSQTPARCPAWAIIRGRSGSSSRSFAAT